MQYFPAFFNLNGQSVLVVGGGEVAKRKLALLMRTGARITLVAPRILPELEANAARGELQFFMRVFEPADLDGKRMVIVATSRRGINRWIANLCEIRGLPVNVVDDRESSRFIVPAMIDRDPVLIAISTGGSSPVLARRLREKLEAAIPQRFGELAVWLRTLRRTANQKLTAAGATRRFFETLADGPAARRYIAGDKRGAMQIAQQLLETAAHGAPPAGEVTLVGAGPGDPELLTLRGLRALQDADVIFYDRLVSPGMLDLARRDAERIAVGKSRGDASTSQSKINALLIEHARRGRRVVRLKGGDPFIFGRGGEELQALAAAGIAFSVVPGITAAAGCAAYAGIPLTHRDYSHGVSFVTGHSDEEGKEPDWAVLASQRQTTVFYMGVAHAGHIAAKLIEFGAPANRPVAMIAQGTTEKQHTVVATLETLKRACEAAQVQSPALLIIGDVVNLQGALSWRHDETSTRWSQSA